MTLAPPDSGLPELSVVMVTYGARELAERAVATLLAHTKSSFELIVVDNGSDDQTRAWLSELYNARVILNDENR